VYNINMLLVFI